MLWHVLVARVYRWRMCLSGRRRMALPVRPALESPARWPPATVQLEESRPPSQPFRPANYPLIRYKLPTILIKPNLHWLWFANKLFRCKLFQSRKKAGWGGLGGGCPPQEELQGGSDWERNGNSSFSNLRFIKYIGITSCKLRLQLSCT